MDNGLTGLIGLARKAGKAEVGDEPVSIAARTHKARLILMASDAAGNTIRHGESLGETGNCPALTLPLTKAELGWALGRSSCALMALTDVGLAAAVADKLAREDPERYGEAQKRLGHKAEKTLRRRRERQRQEKAEKSRRKKPWAPPPPEKKPL